MTGGTQRPGLPLVGMLAIAAGATIAVSAVLTAVSGEQRSASTSPTTREAPTRTPGTRPEPDSPDEPPVSDPSKWQRITTPGGDLSYEAPLQWPTLVFVSSSGGGDEYGGVGAVAKTLDDYKAATTEGIVAVATGPTTATSAGLQGALIGNSATFCPASGCATGKITEIDTQFPASLTQVDSQYAVAPPATGTTGELRYTIETAPPTRYVVFVVHAVDPNQGEVILKHALETLQLG